MPDNSTVTEAVDPASDESAIVRVRLLALAGPLAENVCNDLLRVCDLAMRSAFLPSGEDRAEIARIVHEAMVHAVTEFKGRPEPWQNGNSTAESYARRTAVEVLEALSQGEAPQSKEQDDG